MKKPECGLSIGRTVSLILCLTNNVNYCDDLRPALKSCVFILGRHVAVVSMIVSQQETSPLNLGLAFLRGVCIFSLSLRGFTYVIKTCRWRLVNWRLQFDRSWTCDRLPTCPGCSPPPLAQSQMRFTEETRMEKLVKAKGTWWNISS